MNTGGSRQRSAVAISFLAAACVVGAAQPSHAMLGFLKYIFFSPKKEVHEVKHQGVLVGQKVHVFDLHQSSANDLQGPLQSYIDGIKSNGSVVTDPTKNALIVTDIPENLGRIERLIESMDIPYTNPSADARQILVMQQMMKAIHALGPMAAASSSASSATPVVAAFTTLGVTPVSNGVFQPEAASEENESHTQWKIIEDRPSISGLRVIGWVKDPHDTIVVLRNPEGQRYVYRDGHLIEGRSFSNSDFIEGISGRVSGNVLMLEDRLQGKTFLNMVPPIDRLGEHP